MLGKFIYIEFHIPIRDYLSILTWKEAFFDLIIPLIVAIVSYCFIFNCANIDKLATFTGLVINFLAILIGFSITSLTILSSESGNSFETLKKYDSKRNIGNKPITGYQLILITFICVILVEFITLAYNLTYYLLWVNGFLTSYVRIIIAINIFLMLHIIMLNIRNITNFFFIFWKS